MTRGRSFEQTFRDLHADRVPTKATERQLYLASLIYTPVAVDRHGRVQIHGWTYGGTGTRDVLREYHGDKQRILLGRNPRNFNDPAIAWNEAGDLICEGIEAIERTPYDSVEGARIAGRDEKKARKNVAAGLAAESFLSDQQMLKAWADLTPPESVLDEQYQTVVGAHFGAPVARNARPPVAETKVSGDPIPAEYLRNFADALKAGRGKSA